jgi:hypothetical protein
MKCQAIICGHRIYHYKDWLFEYGYCGPWPLKQDRELRARAGRKFYAMIREWENLPDREKYRVGGGCVRW